MKKAYYKSTAAYFGQIFIWFFIATIFVILLFISGDFSKDNVEVILTCILIAEAIVSLCVPATMRKVVFSNNAVSVKIGIVRIKRIPYNDIKYIDIIRKMSGPHPISYVFLSKQVLSKDQVANLFDKQSFMNKEDIIFCEYPQSDLKDFLEDTFATLFSTENTNDFFT